MRSTTECSRVYIWESAGRLPINEKIFDARGVHSQNWKGIKKIYQKRQYLFLYCQLASMWQAKVSKSYHLSFSIVFDLVDLLEVVCCKTNTVHWFCKTLFLTDQLNPYFLICNVLLKCHGMFMMVSRTRNTCQKYQRK